MRLFSMIGCVPILLELLTTQKERAKGFMACEKAPNSGFGLCFFHEKAILQSYWMKNVPFDLEALGFDQNNCLAEILPLKAGSEISRPFSIPVKHVVEVRAGWCQENKIQLGCKLKFQI